MDNQFDRVVDALPGLVWTARPDGSVDFVNRRWQEYTGLALAEAGWGATIHADDWLPFSSKWQSVLASGKPGGSDARLRRFDGVYRRFQFLFSPQTDASGRISGWCGIVTDIEDRKRAEALLSGEKSLLEMVARGDAMPAILESLCRFIESADEGSYCSVVLIDKTGAKLEHGAAPSLPASFLDSIIGRPVNAESGPCAMAAYLDKQVIAADITTDTRWSAYSWCPMALAHGLKACWSIPIPSAAGKVLGAFAIYYAEPKSPTPQHQVLIDQLTHIASIVIERERVQTSLEGALEDVKQSEKRLHTIIDTIPIVAWGSHPDGSGEFWNRRWHDYTGLASAVAKGQGWEEAIHPDDLSPLMLTWRASLAAGEAGEVEGRLRRFDGQYRWFLFRYEPLRDGAGNILSWYGANTDIEDRKQAEALLGGEKRLLEMIASGQPLPTILDALCRLIEEIASGCHCGILFFGPGGETWQHGAGPDLPSGYNETMHGRPANRTSGPCGLAASQKQQVIVRDVETDMRWEASGWRTLALKHGLRSCWSSPILSQDQSALGALALYWDEPGTPSQFQTDLIQQATQIAGIAVERTRDFAALKRGEAFLAKAQHLSATCSFSWHVKTDEITWSDEAYRIFELDKTLPMSFERISSRVHPEDALAVNGVIQQARAAGTDFEFEYRLLMPGQLSKHLHIVAHATRDESGDIEYIGAIQDVTERRSSEELLGKTRSELAHVTRVSSLGALTASIAHEVNQPLSGIVTNASTCLRMLAADPPNIDGARETARRTIRDGNRASDVIQRLRALFSKTDASTEPMDLNEAAREVIALSLSELQRKRVILRAKLAEDLPSVMGDRVQLQQVILNLLLNASEAMSSVEDRPRNLVVKTQRDENDWVRLAVQDSGVGISAESMERLFEAFYTTKNDGMGIGLSVSRSIIERHEGRLWAASNERFGATFSFSIPRKLGGTFDVGQQGAARHQSARTTQPGARIA